MDAEEIQDLCDLLDLNWNAVYIPLMVLLPATENHYKYIVSQSNDNCMWTQACCPRTRRLTLQARRVSPDWSQVAGRSARASSHRDDLAAPCSYSTKTRPATSPSHRRQEQQLSEPLSLDPSWTTWPWIPPSAPSVNTLPEISSSALMS